jgi:hypothetical protein
MNDEARMTNDQGMTKSENQNVRDYSFVIRALEFIRHSSFIIRHSHHVCSRR